MADGLALIMVASVAEFSYPFFVNFKMNFSDILDLCLHWVSVVRAKNYVQVSVRLLSFYFVIKISLLKLNMFQGNYC